MKVSLVTLGCAKNEVDSEMLLGFLKNIGFNHFKFYLFFHNLYISITKYIKSVIFLFKSHSLIYWNLGIYGIIFILKGFHLRI